MLYFSNNSTLLQIYDIVFHWLGHVIRCLCGILDSGSAKMSRVLIIAVINFTSGTENQTRLQKSVGRPDYNLITFI